jgi:hypothetical protein
MLVIVPPEVVNDTRLGQQDSYETSEYLHSRLLTITYDISGVHLLYQQLRLL